MNTEKLWTRNYIVCTLASLLFFLSFQFIIPVLPLYIHMISGNDMFVGLVAGSGTLGGFLLRPVTGRLIDRTGRRLPYYFVGLVLSCLFIFSYSFASLVPLLFIVRFLHGAGMGMFTTASMTIVTDLIPRPRLTEGLGYFNTAATVAMAIAPAVGLYLLEVIDYYAIFTIGALVILLTLLISVFGLRVKPVQKLEQPIKGGFFERRALLPALLLMIQTSAQSAITVYIALYGQMLGIGNIGFVFSVFALAVIVSRLGTGRLADRRGYAVVLIPGMAVAALAFVFLGLGHSLLMFSIAAALFGLGFGSIFPVLSAMGVGRVEPGRRGAANSTIMCGFDLGIGIGAIVWGAVSQLYSYSVMYWINVPVLLFALIVYIASLVWNRRRGGRPSEA